MRGLSTFFAIILLLASGSALAATEFAGYWDGAIEFPGMSLAIRIHFIEDDQGVLGGTIDIPAQGATGLALSDVTVDGNKISCALAEVPGDPAFNGTLADDRIAGLFSQSGQPFAFALTRGTAEAPRRPQDPVPPFPYATEDVTIDRGDVTLAGTLTIPDGDGPFPALVMLTGSGAQNRDEEILDHRPFWVIADHLARHGIASLRCDDRGVGGSTGAIASSTTADFVDDALAGVTLLRDRDEIAADRVGLLGHSEGGVIVPLAAAQSREVAFLVLLAAPGVPAPELMALQVELLTRASGESEERVQEHIAINREVIAAAVNDDVDAARAKLRRLIERQFELSPAGSRPGTDDLEATIQAHLAHVMSPAFQGFLRLDPREALRAVRVPVLALNGTLDLQVDDEQNLTAIEAALAEGGNEDVTVRALPGLNHLFQSATTGLTAEYGSIEETISPEVLEMISGWVVERFGD